MPSRSPEVSVVLPVFNGERFVSDAIQSIRQQTLEDWELLILDDGSTDSSLSVCRALAALDPRVKVFSNPANLGLARTMNALVSLVNGRYVAVQEQDDVSLPHRLSAEVSVLESMPEVGIVSGIAAWIDDKGRVFNHFPGILTHGGQYPQDRRRMVEYLYVEQCKVVNAGAMFRRSVLDEFAPPFDEGARMSIDWQFFIHVAHRHRILGLPDVVVKMHRGSAHESLTGNKELQFREARRCIGVILRRYARQRESPISPILFRRAMATQLVLEGRYYGGIDGALRLGQAVLYDPTNRLAWRSLMRSVRRAASKAWRLG